MKRTKWIAIAIIAIILLAAAGCGAKKAHPVIGVVQLAEHIALDQSFEGFQKALEDHDMLDKLEIDYQNAQGDINNLSTIADRFVSRKVDMILAIATDSAQSVAGKTDEIPILGTAITSYTVAGLVESDEHPGGNVTGTSDMNPVAAQIALIRELIPEAKVIGLVYNSGEDNSVLQVKIAKEVIEDMGLEWREVTVTNTNDVPQAVQSIVTKCDALYIPTDNTMSSAMAQVHGVTSESKTPTICGESAQVLQGGLVSMGISYFDLGYKTGLMALEVLAGKKPAELPIQYADKSDEVVINGFVAEEIGFSIPDKFQDAVIWPED